MIVGYGQAADGATSRLVGVSGSFSVAGSKNNEWLALCRKRGARDSNGVERDTNHCMVNIAVDGDGHYIFLVGEFFPGLLKSTKIVNNSNVTDSRPAEAHSLTDKPRWSFTVAHTEVEMTDTLSLVVDSVQLVHRLSGEAGSGNPYVSLTASQTREPYYDGKAHAMDMAKERLITLAGGRALGKSLEAELAGDWEAYSGTFSGLRLTFSSNF